jgi:hypothetical protein
LIFVFCFLLRCVEASSSANSNSESRKKIKFPADQDNAGILPIDDSGGQFGVPGKLGAHDVGGSDLFLSKQVDASEKPIKFWEQKTHAAVVSLVSQGLLSIDLLRRSVEGLDYEDYKDWGYYARWALCIANILVEKGVLSSDDLHTALGVVGGENLNGSDGPLLKAGARVRVRQEDKNPRARKPHLRTPGYIFGAKGVVVSYEGLFADPTLAVLGISSKQHLYKVSFLHRDIWKQTTDTEQGDDVIEADIYESWLELDSGLPSDDISHHCENHHNHHHHDHSDDDHEEHDHHDHVHLSREATEQKAVDLEGPQSHDERVSEAVLELLLQKGIIDMPSIMKGIDALEVQSCNTKNKNNDNEISFLRCFFFFFDRF